MTVLSPKAIAARAKKWIVADVLDGKVPADVDGFADLHDYVDANEYLQIVGDDDGVEISADGWATDESHKAWVDRLNAASGMVDEWIADGGLYAAALREQGAWMSAHVGRSAGPSSEWSRAAWHVGDDIWLVDDESGGFDLVKRTTTDDDDTVTELRRFANFQAVRKWVESGMRSTR